MTPHSRLRHQGWLYLFDRKERGGFRFRRTPLGLRLVLHWIDERGTMTPAMWNALVAMTKRRKA